MKEVYWLNFHSTIFTRMLDSDTGAPAVIVVPPREKVKLSIIGTMMYYYWLAYKEPFPKTPNNTEQQRINEIWLAMNIPENVVPI
jgi:hypothetical protein